MKNLLLFAVALSISLVTFAQNRDFSVVEKMDSKSIIEQRAIIDIPGPAVGEILEKPITSSSKNLNKTDIFTSANVYGLFVYSERVVSAHPDINMVVFGNRAGGPSGLTGNDLKIAYSFDDGNSFDEAAFIAPANHGFRYPSSIIYNPPGNTDPDNMFGIVSGPYVYPIGEWGGQFFGSMRLDGQNVDITFDPNDANIYINHLNINLTESVSGRFHVISDRLEGIAGAWDYMGAEILNGTFNTSTNQVDWELPRILLQPSLVPGENYYWGGTNMAYSPDGSVGYIIGMGVDSDPDYSPYGLRWPVVYKTHDQGLTWEKTDPFDFSVLDAFEEVIWPTAADTTVFIPQFTYGYVGSQSDFGITVDHNNNLHIFAQVKGASSIHPDSTYYAYTNEPLNLFHMIMDYDNEQWSATYITTLVTAQQPAAGDDNMGWDHRMQMARTDDGKKIGLVWTDTDFGIYETNSNPDIYVYGYDAPTAKYTDIYNKTFGTDYWLENYWMHLSDKLIEDGDNYCFPLSTSVPGVNDLQPLMNQYLQGLCIDITTNTQELRSSKANLFTASQNYPNPVSGTTQFVLDLNIASSVSIELYNLMGQQVHAFNYDRMHAGRHILQLDLSGYSSGVYFYTIKVAGQTETRKLIIQ